MKMLPTKQLPEQMRFQPRRTRSSPGSFRIPPMNASISNNGSGFACQSDVPLPSDGTAMFGAIADRAGLGRQLAWERLPLCGCGGSRVVAASLPAEMLLGAGPTKNRDELAVRGCTSDAVASSFRPLRELPLMSCQSWSWYSAATVLVFHCRNMTDGTNKKQSCEPEVGTTLGTLPLASDQ
ncbi:hypothetical protein BC827DRAFT_1387475 [Russula dissimulans]|nr:hypothetical protein BC827DRAFT_1387475 [Russula dissimulans]